MPRLRVGFNARTFSSPRLRGFSRHALSLLRALRALADAPEIHLFSDVPLAPELAGELAGFPLHLARVRPHLAWEQVALPALLRRAGVSVFHAATNIGVPAWAPGIARVATVHDLITARELESPLSSGSWPRFKASASHAVSWRAALAAEALITVSRFSLEELVAAYPETRARARVIPNGVDGAFAPGEADSGVLARSGLRAPYFLYVGGFEPRKNVRLLLEAFALCEERGALLALAGDAAGAPEALRLAADGDSRVRWLGYVAEAELVALYRGATAVVVPSREEGFGFPVLEAFACGAPVFCSEASSLPEVGGSAAAYFPVDSTAALAALLARALRDPAWLAYFRQKGLERAREFTWERVARETVSVYRGLTTGVRPQ
jgi:glycosyltransferase involved in cell wall biosynthesis